MKVYSCPKELPAPKIDVANFDWTKHDKAEAAHKKALAKWLKEAGYTGKYTGELVSFPVADGYAQYMMADGPKSFLVHLPYGDAWQYRDVEFLPKKEIIRRIEAEKKFHEIFHRKSA